MLSLAVLCLPLVLAINIMFELFFKTPVATAINVVVGVFVLFIPIYLLIFKRKKVYGLAWLTSCYFLFASISINWVDDRIRSLTSLIPNLGGLSFISILILTKFITITLFLIPLFYILSKAEVPLVLVLYEWKAALQETAAVKENQNNVKESTTSMKWLNRLADKKSVSNKSNKEKPVWPSVTIAHAKDSRKKVVIPGIDRFLHLLILGTTGSGKTAYQFEPQVQQDMDFIAKGGKATIIVVEPNHTFAKKIADRAKSMNLPYVFINESYTMDKQRDPNYQHDFVHLNPFEGELNSVAETITTVLKAMFGQQEDFFSNVQEAASRNIVYMLKLLYGDMLTMRQFADVLRSGEKLLERMRDLTELVKRPKKRPEWWGEDELEIAENVLGSLEGSTKCSFRTSQPTIEPKGLDHFMTVAMGLQQQIDKIIGNTTVRRILGHASTFHISDMLEQGGMIILNTGNHEAGKTLGKFFLLLLQDALLKRPGDEDSRSGVYCYIDEFAEYVTSPFLAAFTQARKYRTSFAIAIQSIVQLELPDDRNYGTKVKGNCRNKIVLPGLDEEDARAAEITMGRQEVEDRSTSHASGILGRTSLDERVTKRLKEQSIIGYTQLMYMPKDECVYKIVVNGQQQRPAIGKMSFADRTIRYRLNRVESIPITVDGVSTQSTIKGLFVQEKARMPITVIDRQNPVPKFDGIEGLEDYTPGQITFDFGDDKLELEQQVKRRTRTRGRR